jgi:hypothetical protein
MTVVIGPGQRVGSERNGFNGTPDFAPYTVPATTRWWSCTGSAGTPHKVIVWPTTDRPWLMFWTTVRTP